MNQLTLHIKYKLVAALEADKVGLSTDYQIVDIANLGEKKSNVSQVFKLPATPELKQALGFPENYNSIDAANPKQSIVGELKENGETIISGLIKFKGTTIVNQKVYYQLSIVGDSAIWANELNDKRLRHLDLWNHTHTWTQSVQNASELISAMPYVYSLINSGKLGIFYVHEAALGNGNSVRMIIKGQIFSSDFTNQSITVSGFSSSEYNKEYTSSQYTIENLYNGTDSRITLLNTTFQPFDVVPEYGYIQINKTSNIRVRVTDRYPMIRESFLIEKIFNEIGYRIESNYLNTILSKKYTVQEANKGWQGQERFKDFAAFKIGIIEDVVFPAAPGNFVDYHFPFNDKEFGSHFDNGNFFDTDDYHYKPKIAKRQDFDFAFTFQVNGSLTLSVWVETNTQFFKIVTLQNFSTGTHTLESNLSAFVNVSENDAVRVRIRIQNSTNSVTFKKGNCFFWNEIRFKAKTEGDNIYLVEHLPDVSQLAYFQGIVKRDGLIVMTDINTKTVYIEDFDGFIDKSNVVDWTNKTDASQPIESIEVLENPPKGIWYKYSNDGNDINLKRLSEVFNIEYGSFKFDYKNIFKGTDYTEYTNSLFSATLEQAASSIGININIPIIELENYDDLHKTRVLYYNGPTILSNTWKQGNNNRSHAPIAFFLQSSFKNNKSLHYEDGVLTTGLANRNFGTLHKEIDESIYFTVFLHLNAFDIAQFVNIDKELKRDFRAIFRIKTAKGTYLCRLVKIENYQSNSIGSTKCHFIKLTDTYFDNNEVDIAGSQDIGLQDN